MTPLIILPGTIDEPTGIACYANRIAEHPSVTPHRPPKHEVEFLGKAWGGYVTTWWNTLVGSIPETDLVHAADIHTMHRRVDVLTVHDTVALDRPAEYGTGTWFWRLFKHRLPKLDAVIVPSHHTRRRLDAHLDLDNVHVVPHGIDPTIYHPRHTDRALDQRDRVHVCMVGEWRQRKNSLEAIHAVTKLDRPVVLHRAGPKRIHLDAYRSKCLEMLDVDRYVDHGYLDPVALSTLYSWCHALVYPSEEEGYGLPPVEAAACGTPTVTGPCRVFDETLDDLHHASDGTAHGIQQAIQDAIEQPAPAKRLIEHATQRTWHDAVSDTIDVYHEATR